MFTDYRPTETRFDEVVETGGTRELYVDLCEHFTGISDKDYRAQNEYAKVSFFNQGITFAVYTDKQKGVERIFPFDLFPRIITAEEWDALAAGIIQRNRAINAFLHDIYHDKRVLKDNVIPADLVFSSKYYLKEMEGLNPPGGVYVHINGTDLIRHNDGDFYVLEDNCRTPSGVSYVLANRVAMKRTFARLFATYEVETVEDYPQQLMNLLQSLKPAGATEPTSVILTPGVHNSAYFEHAYLANKMGIELVEGRDLFVDNNFVFMKTIDGPHRVDVIYRRVDDDFLDPMTFRPDSVLGVAGLMSAYRAGNVTLVNAPGTGISDDKAIYSYMPEFIRYYLGEEPMIKNVPTFRCGVPSERKHVLENIHDLVVKPVDESGGYGILIGPNATDEELADYRRKIEADPRKYIAQPVMSLSMHPTYIEDDKRFEPRHVDLRIFSLTGGAGFSYVLPGGLTRVALRRGSLIVNSSQGGGSKDTWVVR